MQLKNNVCVWLLKEMCFPFLTKRCEWRGRLNIGRCTVTESWVGCSKRAITDSDTLRRTDIEKTGGRRAQPALMSRWQISDVLQLVRLKWHHRKNAAGNFIRSEYYWRCYQDGRNDLQYTKNDQNSAVLDILQPTPSSVSQMLDWNIFLFIAKNTF